jgi:hypothetical protein
MKLKEPRNKKGNPKLYYNEYYNAYYCAKKRNIDWHFTYDTWINWWGEDITNRGTYKGQLVMARNGDIGPYHPDNVRKATCSENCSEGSKGKSKPCTMTADALKMRGLKISASRRKQL